MAVSKLSFKVLSLGRQLRKKPEKKKRESDKEGEIFSKRPYTLTAMIKQRHECDILTAENGGLINVMKMNEQSMYPTMMAGPPIPAISISFHVYRMRSAMGLSRLA